MAKITRKTSTIFAGAAPAQDIEQFGSKVQTGTPNYTTDPNTIQDVAAWGDGWSQALVVANNSEYKQDRNAVDYVASYQISYLLQQGLADKKELKVKTGLICDFIRAEDFQCSLDVADVMDYLDADWNSNDM